jgi:cytochrome c peroxidase
MKLAPTASALALTALVTAGCGSADAQPAPTPPGPAIIVPSGFPAFVVPEDNEPTAARIELGRRLFYDERLSRTEEVACASCHRQEHAFADPERFSRGVEGRLGTRNSTALVNAAWGTSFFWHGGTPSLELQAVAPIKNPLEMDMTLAEVAERLAEDRAIVAQFERAYDDAPNESTITRALASFVRSLVSAESAYDRFLAGDEAALSEAARRGEALFNGERGECFHCHAGYNLTTNTFKNNGTSPDDPDEGRREVTLRDSDFGKFKVPTLRNVAASAPYMHDGSLATLEEVIDAYAAGGRGHPNTDPTIVPLELTDSDKADLLAFLEALTDDAFLTNPAFAEPER